MGSAENAALAAATLSRRPGPGFGLVTGELAGHCDDTLDVTRQLDGGPYLTEISQFAGECHDTIADRDVN